MNTSYNFLKYELNRTFSIKKYIFIIILYSFMVINAAGIINSYEKFNVNFNFWDLVLLIFTDPKNIVIILIFSFVILLNDIVIDGNFESEMILKFGSRRIWWNVKICVLFIKSIMCIASIAILTIIVSMRFKFSLRWSNGFIELARISAKRHLFYSSPINLDILKQSPVLSFQETLLLLLLGFLAIGLFVMVVTLIFNNKIITIISGFFILIIAAIPAFEMKSSILTNIIYNHILINTHSFYNVNSPFPSIGYSISHWIIYIVVLYIIGYKLSLRKNFISKNTPNT